MSKLDNQELIKQLQQERGFINKKNYADYVKDYGNRNGWNNVDYTYRIAAGLQGVPEFFSEGNIIKTED